jgi:hypothetical protein
MFREIFDCAIIRKGMIIHVYCLCRNVFCKQGNFLKLMPATQGSPVTVLTPTTAVTPELALMLPIAVTPAKAVTQKQ